MMPMLQDFVPFPVPTQQVQAGVLFDGGVVLGLLSAIALLAIFGFLASWALEGRNRVV